eukprot:4322103-Amphidinium_carterae.1
MDSSKKVLELSLMVSLKATEPVKEGMRCVPYYSDRENYLGIPCWRSLVNMHAVKKSRTSTRVVLLPVPQ